MTKPNTSCTIEVPASLRSESCSPSARNAVRVPSGMSVHLRRNPQQGAVWVVGERDGAALGVGDAGEAGGVEVVIEGARVWVPVERGMVTVVSWL